MDGLDLLEALVSNSGTGVEPALVEAGPPPTKRSRGARATSSMLGAAASSSIVSQTGSGSARDESEAATDRAEKSCLGCGRVAGRGRCYVDPAEVMAWTNPDLRGDWCRDCHTVWRVCYSAVLTLTLLQKWLGQSEANKTDFEVNLVAAVSLRHEGETKLTAASVAKRAALLRWLSRMFGVCLQPAAAVPIAELAASHEHKIDAAHLITMIVNGKATLGAVVPCSTLVPPDAAEIPRPLGDRSPVVGRPLFTSTPDDLAHVGLLCGDAAYSHKLPDPSEVAITPYVGGGQTKLGAKIAVRVDATKEILKVFNTPTWGEELKEGVFTGPLTKFQQLVSEATQADQRHALTTSTSWVAGLTDVKAFAKLWGNYTKAKFHVSRLPAFAPLVKKLCGFFEKVGIEVDVTFELFKHKAVFYDIVNSPATCNKYIFAAFEAMVKMDLRGVLERASSASARAPSQLVRAQPAAEQNAFSAASWIRTVLLVGLQALAARDLASARCLQRSHL